MQHTEELIFDEVDIQKILEGHVRNYEYHNSNKAPTAIVLPMVSQLYFKTAGNPDGVSIPVNYSTVDRARSDNRTDISLHEAAIVRDQAGKALESEIGRADKMEALANASEPEIARADAPAKKKAKAKS